ncbi:MAG: metal-dependent hydrolase [Verrucomicrobia bacterium]|nr:metal-dependent hydrolase [Verrucomicrobiota bacterium]
MKATFLGHATVYLESSGTKILVDPFLTGNPKTSAKADDLEADFIVLTHGHNDHIADALPIAKRTGASIISTFELACWLGNQGAKASPQNHGGWCKYPFGAVKFTPAFHSSSVPDENGRPTYLGDPAGAIIQIGAKTVFHAGDTALFSDMRLIGDDVAIDLAFLPIGEHFTMGPKDAAKAVEFLHPQVVVPIHYGTFPALFGDPKEFARLAEGKAKVAILGPGESVEV